MENMRFGFMGLIEPRTACGHKRAHFSSQPYVPFVPFCGSIQDEEGCE